MAAVIAAVPEATVTQASGSEVFGTFGATGLDDTALATGSSTVITFRVPPITVAS